MSDTNEFIADSFHGLVIAVQDNAVAEADRARADERAKAQALREQAKLGINTSELLKAMSGDDQETQQAKLDAEMERINREAAEAAAEAEKAGIQPVTAKYPPPIITVK